VYLYKIKFSFIFLIVVNLFSLPANAEKDYSQLEFRNLKNDAFGLGETLNYNVGMGAVKAGTGFIKVMPEPSIVFGRKCYEVRFGASSLKSLDWLYKVRDEYTSWIDINSIFSWKFKQKIREGKYKHDFQAVFDQSKNIAVTKDTTIRVEPNIQDIISAFMYVRTLDLKKFPKDSSIYLRNFWKDSTYKLAVKVVRRETIKVPAGKFKCVVVEPTILGGGLFKNEEKIWIWLSDDDRKIPVKVGTKILIGYVGAELSSYTGVRGKIDAKID